MIDPYRAALYTAVAILLGIFRLSGVHGEVFQAIAHLYVGAFLGAAALGAHHRVGGWRYYAGLAAALSALEVFAFLTGIGRPH
jgi:hypothetical protein